MLIVLGPRDEREKEGGQALRVSPKAPAEGGMEELTVHQAHLYHPIWVGPLW